MNGVIAPPEAATIPVTDEGLLRGDGAFEGLRLYGGRPFALEDHLRRLDASAAGLHLPVDTGALRAELDALLAAAEPVGDALLRIVVTRGGQRIVLVEPLRVLPPVARVATIPFEPGHVLDGLKTLSYAANMLAGRLARERGGDEGLLVTAAGQVLEGTNWSLFWVRDGRLLTPPLGGGILASITRARILEECDVDERPCSLDDLAAAEEAFIASTLREVMPIGSLDGVAFPAAPGPVTREARARFRRRVERECGAGAGRTVAA